MATMRSGTASRSARSCETTRRVPGNASSAASSASRLSMSRWFVGSSRTRKFAPDATSSASESLRRSPPESAVTDRSCVSQPEKRKRPRSICACGLGRPVAACRAVEHGALRGQLERVLGEVAGDHAVPEAGGAAVERMPAEQSEEQGRLPAAVRADEADLLATLDRKRRILEQQLVARGERDALGLEDDAPGARRAEEVEPERPSLAGEGRELLRRTRSLLLEAPDLRELRLRLLRLRLLVPESGHEPLEALDVVGHAADGLLRRDCARRLLAPPLVPRAGEVVRPRRPKLEHGGRDGLQEPAVVGDEDDGSVDRLELALQPLEVLDVQVVRRLVEEQEVGLARQDTRKGSSRHLASGERAERPVEVVLGEAEAAHRRCGVVAPAPAARVLEPRLSVGVPPKRDVVVCASRHRLLEAPELGLRLEQVARARERVLAECEIELERRALVVERDPGSLREGELSALQRRLADNRPQERRLPRPVGTGQGRAIAPADGERDPVEERVAGELLAELGCDQDRHGGLRR